MNAKRPTSLEKLPDAELEVMACLWREGRATARQIRELMEAYRPMAHGSVVTLLNRLESKGLVKRRKADSGKAFVFAPTRKPGPTYRGLLRDVLQRIFGGDGVAMVASLFDTRPPTPAELDQLQALLDDLRQRGGEAKGGESR